jgi:hypothetical protein
MTDRDMLTLLLMKWQVPFVLDGDDIQVEDSASSTAVTGYAGFYTVFEFDVNGDFLRMGAWE